MPFWKRRPSRPDTPDDVEDVALSDVRDLPAVTAAIAACPTVWRNATWRADPQLTDPSDLDASLDEVLDCAWVSRNDGQWQLAVADEVFPLLDLDADEETDPIISALLNHPAVTDAFHEDREVYLWTADATSVEDAAALALAALTAGHRHALRLADITD